MFVFWVKNRKVVIIQVQLLHKTMLIDCNHFRREKCRTGTSIINFFLTTLSFASFPLVCLYLNVILSNASETDTAKKQEDQLF